MTSSGESSSAASCGGEDKQESYFKTSRPSRSKWAQGRRHHLVIQNSQRLVGGEVLQLGLEDDGASSPARLDHLLPVLVVEAAFVLDQAEHAQVLAHVARHRTLAELQTLRHRAEVKGHSATSFHSVG